ncbi:hypothetical protein MKW98_017473 [Papaver atlanticum]|uniref:DNA topoisomerase n=1 Tax=Papaver atlanticum TaxID=357466 RepID=A0AAD4XVE2_9MAGN|nr:hypothetical protein MKW98_017473 [Papaver atlanticum]
MALQLHKLLNSNCFRRNLSVSSPPRIMNYMTGNASYSTANPCFNGKLGQLQFLSSREECMIANNRFKDLRFKVGYDSQFFRSFSTARHHGNLTNFPIQSHLSVGIPKSKTVGSSFRLDVLFYEGNGRRLFSAKPSNQKPKVPSALVNKNENASVGGESSRKAFYAPRKRTRTPGVRHSAGGDGGKQVAVEKQVVKGKDSNKQVAQTGGTLKPVDKVTIGVKKGVDESSILTEAKINGNDHKGKALANKKHKSGKKGHVQHDTSTKVLSATTKAGDFKEVIVPENANVSVGDRGDSSRKSFYARRKRAKMLAIRSSSGDGGNQVAVEKKVVGKEVAESNKKVAQAVDTLKPTEVRVGDKKDAQQSSISTEAKVNSYDHKKNTPAKKKHNSRNKEQIQNKNDTKVVSGATKAAVSTGVTLLEKKPNIDIHSRHSQTSDSVPVCGKQLPAVDSPGSEHQQSEKKRTIFTEKNRALKKDLTSKNSDKVSLQQSNSVPGKLEPPIKKLSPLYPPTGKSVVVVESLKKAKIVQGYLGDLFEVLSSNGHVRMLARWAGAVRPDDDFSMVWGVPDAAWTQVKSMKVALNGAKNLILASDPSCEGEAIAWHLTEMLQQQDALHDNITIARVVFNELTESSIKAALQSPRDINMDLVHSYLSRRALDYLIAYNLTPLLDKKLPGCLSVGRVEHTALSLLCDAETQIDEFKPREYWTVEVEFSNKIVDSLKKNFSIKSHLINARSKQLEQLSTKATDIQKKITSSCFKVVGCKRTKTRQNPPMPYITSTLQQDAANKLHFSASTTMMLAKGLYEGVKIANKEAVGLITYMQTDDLHVPDAAAEDVHSLVLERYGQKFASKGARKYCTKLKNAQEVHEAIRPTDIRRLPSLLAGVLDEDSLKLYTLIWLRTMACQMEPALIDQIQVDIGAVGESTLLQSTCSSVEFLGYQTAYKDAEAASIAIDMVEVDACKETFKFLCALKSGDPFYPGNVELKQHFTEPPPRYTEGSLIEKLERLGVGRPSTYATTIKALQERKYLTVKNRELYPEFRARMVSQFLTHFFSEVNDYSFTANTENELAKVSAGLSEWKGLMKDFWTHFSKYCSRAGNASSRQIETVMEKAFPDFLFGSLPGKSRTCPRCKEGNLIFRITGSAAGYFVGCDKHPKCKYVNPILRDGEEEEVEEHPDEEDLFDEPTVIGMYPGSDEKIYLKTGPYGGYVQLGDDRKGFTPKRAPLGKMDPNSITLEHALELLSYPKTLGNHPDDDKPVFLRTAPKGYAIRHRRTTAPVPKNMDPKKVTLEDALKYLSGKGARHAGRPKNKPKAEIYEA